MGIYGLLDHAAHRMCMYLVCFWIMQPIECIHIHVRVDHNKGTCTEWLEGLHAETLARHSSFKTGEDENKAHKQWCLAPASPV